MIIIDTNMLLVPGQLKVDIFDQLSFFSKDLTVIDKSILELEKLASDMSADARNAQIALELLKKNDVRILYTKEKYTDEAILSLAKIYKCFVATNDKALIKRLKYYGIQVLRLRQNKIIIKD